MKNRFRRLLALLLAVALTGSLCGTALAAGADSGLISISAPESAKVGKLITVQVQATEGGKVGDGKLVVTYNSALLCYVGAEAGKAWPADVVLSDNGSVKGKVVLAFAGDEAAEAGSIANLTFLPLGVGETTVAVDGDGSYVTGQSGDLGAEATITLENKPDAGLPVEPAEPSEPSGSGSSGSTGDGLCDGGVNCPSRGFTDVNFTGDYHYGIDFMVSNGYMNGTSATAFSPDLPMNRAMLVTILYRLAGEPAVSGSNVFTDVKESDYFYKAVLWASSNGITTGTSATTFSPADHLTREQIAAFLYRYAQFAGKDTSARDSLSKYTDAGTISTYATEAMQWAVGSGIINGVTSTTLQPKANATRVQIAVMVWRFAR